ncbi:hypothetical protein [Achromobacter xylosoxidans]|uniref:hypothetical protein n=1 Tax=Alcaligenes xylosoxydans xylosoxydans TaxID=85698 RepID=UPI001F232CF8|nr:hypothetical protein [Achromobacter xylosoxidans]
MRGDQIQVAARPQARARLIIVGGQEAHVAAAAQLDTVKAWSRHHERRGAGDLDLALGAKGQAVADLQQAAGTHGEVARPHRGRIAEQHPGPRQAIGGEVSARARQAHIRGRQHHPAVRRVGPRRQGKRAGIKPQTARGRQVDRASKGHQPLDNRPM